VSHSRHGRFLMAMTGKAWLAVSAAICVAAVAPQESFASDWHLQASVSEEFEYDDNFRLSSTAEETLWGFTTRPRVTLETHTPTVDLIFGGDISYGLFPENSDENSFDQRLDGSISRKGPRSRVSLNGAFTRQTTRTSEDEDTGRDFSDAVRLSGSGGLSGSYQLTELVSLGARTGGVYTTYDTSAFEDFFSVSAGPFVSVQLSQKDTVQFASNYMRFERLSGLDRTSDAFNGDVTYTHIFTEQINASVRGGANHVRTDLQELNGSTVVSRTSNNTGFEGGVTMSYTEERGQLNASFDKGLVPSGEGRLQDRNSVRLNASYRATPMVTTDLTATFIDQTSADDDGLDRTFFSVEPGIVWRFLPDWDFRVAYKFRTQDRDTDGRAYSNGARASVTWRMPGWGARGGVK
jgi:hypothetical protein